MLSFLTSPLAMTFYDSILDLMNRFQMPFDTNKLLWKIIGFSGMFIFGSRTFVQWVHSERHKESKIPVTYWWLSVIGTVLCLAYALRQKDSVFILMYLFNMIPYVRNLMLVRRKKLEDLAPAFPVLPSGKTSGDPS